MAVFSVRHFSILTLFCLLLVMVNSESFLFIPGVDQSLAVKYLLICILSAVYLSTWYCLEMVVSQHSNILMWLLLNIALSPLCIETVSCYCVVSDNN